MLSIDLKALQNGILMACRGEVTGGKEAEYLFDIITRDGEGVVVLDLSRITRIDSCGLSVIALASCLLARERRRLLLHNASAELIHALGQQQYQNIFSGDQYRAAGLGSIQ